MWFIYFETLDTLIFFSLYLRGKHIVPLPMEMRFSSCQHDGSFTGEHCFFFVFVFICEFVLLFGRHIIDTHHLTSEMSKMAAYCLSAV